MKGETLTEPLAPELNRRALLTTLSVGALVGVASKAKAQSTELTETQLLMRLLRRITYGPSEQEVQTAKSMGFDAYLDYQLNYQAIDDSGSEAAASIYSTINFSPLDLTKVRLDVARRELTMATITRAVMSKRQLYQRMVEFWSDHFNVYFEKAEAMKVTHDREVIRKHALGNFRELLMANAKNPAMLVFLDNNTSTKELPNQNYARELMELHTIGVDGGYTQKDVKEVAKCFTGWTVRLYPAEALDMHQFVYDPKIHAGGEKVVLGKVIPTGGGIKDGETVIKMLAARRHTARMIARKLFRFFIGYEPSSTQVEAVADVYMATGGDIKSLLKAVLTRENLATAAPMVKRPFHYAMGLLRQSRARMDHLFYLEPLMFTLGQHPFDWAPPNGYSLSQDYWADGLLQRWNFAFWLFGREIDGVTVDRQPLFRTAVTVNEVVNRISVAMFQGEMSTRDKNRLRAFIGSDDYAVSRCMGAAALAATLPAYQEC